MIDERLTKHETAPYGSEPTVDPAKADEDFSVHEQDPATTPEASGSEVADGETTETLALDGVVPSQPGDLVPEDIFPQEEIPYRAFMDLPTNQATDEEINAVQILLAQGTLPGSELGTFARRIAAELVKRDVDIRGAINDPDYMSELLPDGNLESEEDHHDTPYL